MILKKSYRNVQTLCNQSVENWSKTSKISCIMNVRSLPLYKLIVYQRNAVMKTSLVFKLFFLLSFMLFIDYVSMIAIGCSCSIFGLSNDFFCGPYCLIGKIVIGLSALLFGYLIYPDIAQLFKSSNNAKTSEM